MFSTQPIDIFCVAKRAYGIYALKTKTGQHPPPFSLYFSLSLCVISSDMMYSHMNRAQFEEALYGSHPEASQG